MYTLRQYQQIDDALEMAPRNVVDPRCKSTILLRILVGNFGLRPGELCACSGIGRHGQKGARIILANLKRDSAPSEMGKLTKEMFTGALDEVSRRIAADNSIAKSILPLKLIAVGGFVSLFRWNSRSATEDLDYYFPGLIDENGDVEYMAEVEETLSKHITDAADGDLGELWANNAMMGFMHGDDEKKILQRTMKQGVVLYRSNEVEIYAASWTLQLVQKLVAIVTRDKTGDVPDAACIAREIFEEKGTIIKTSELKAEFRSPNRMEPVRAAAIRWVNRESRSWPGWGKDIIEIDTPLCDD